MVQSSTQRDARRVQLQAIGRLIVIAVLVTFITVAALMRIESTLLDGVLESTTRQPFSASPPFPPASGRRRPPRHRVDRHARGIQRQLPPACRDCRRRHWLSSTGTDAFTAVFCIPITNVAAALPFLTNVAALVLVLLVTLRERTSWCVA